MLVCTCASASRKPEQHPPERTLARCRRTIGHPALRTENRQPAGSRRTRCRRRNRPHRSRVGHAHGVRHRGHLHRERRSPAARRHRHQRSAGARLRGGLLTRIDGIRVQRRGRRAVTCTAAAGLLPHRDTGFRRLREFPARARSFRRTRRRIVLPDRRRGGRFLVCTVDSGGFGVGFLAGRLRHRGARVRRFSVRRPSPSFVHACRCRVGRFRRRTVRRIRRVQRFRCRRFAVDVIGPGLPSSAVDDGCQPRPRQRPSAAFVCSLRTCHSPSIKFFCGHDEVTGLSSSTRPCSGGRSSCRLDRRRSRDCSAHGRQAARPRT